MSPMSVKILFIYDAYNAQKAGPSPNINEEFPQNVEAMTRGGLWLLVFLE